MLQPLKGQNQIIMSLLVVIDEEIINPLVYIPMDKEKERQLLISLIVLLRFGERGRQMHLGNLK